MKKVERIKATKEKRKKRNRRRRRQGVKENCNILCILYARLPYLFVCLRTTPHNVHYIIRILFKKNVIQTHGEPFSHRYSTHTHSTLGLS